MNSDVYMVDGSNLYAMLGIDDDVERIEEEHTGKIDELYEGDYLDIVYEMRGIKADAAYFNSRMYCIEYRYEAESEEEINEYLCVT